MLINLFKHAETAATMVTAAAVVTAAAATTAAIFTAVVTTATTAEVRRVSMCGQLSSVFSGILHVPRKK